MSEGTFRRPPSQEVKDKQEEKREEIGKVEDENIKRRLRKKLGEYYSPSSGWKGINRSPSYWDKIRRQRRKKRKRAVMDKRRNRKGKIRNDKRRKAKKMRRV